MVSLRGRLKRLAANSFEAWVALLAIVAAVSFVLNPEALADSAIGRTFHPFDWVWNLSYGICGIGILWSLWWFRVDWEVVFLVLFCGALSIQVVAILSVGGTAALTTLGVDTAFILACAGRVFSLLRGQDSIVVSHPEMFYGSQ